MIDTGSPVTIVDLDFLVQALAKKRDNQQIPSEWMKAIEQHFEPPGVPLKSYGGEELNLVGQLEAALCYEDCLMTATIQLQKNAPVELLLGTDLRPQLGFAFLAKVNDQTVDMLQQKPWQADCVVHLLKPVCCPAKHMKIIRAQAVGNDGRSLFQPVKHLIQRHGP